jgi:hypothetical protein
VRKLPILCLLAVILVLVPQSHSTQAQSTLDPTVFAAPLSVVTADGGTVTVQRVEDNVTAAADPMFLRPSGTTGRSLSQQGRQTGFQADFLVGTVGYAYSASIFQSSSQAGAAFLAQQAFWKAGSTDPTNSENPITNVGDVGLADWWVGATVSSGTVYAVNEEFFARGRILVEVYLIISADDITALGTSPFALQDALSQNLDQIAVTANIAPTATSTPLPTSTPKPTATPRPAPTAKPVAHTSVKCKKGYKVVKGKCVRKKKKAALVSVEVLSALHASRGVTVTPFTSLAAPVRRFLRMTDGQTRSGVTSTQRPLVRSVASGLFSK